MNSLMFGGFSVTGDFLSLETSNTHRTFSLHLAIHVHGGGGGGGGGSMCILLTLLNLSMTHCLPLDFLHSFPPSNPHPFHNPPKIALYNNSPLQCTWYELQKGLCLFIAPMLVVLLR